jgi:RNA polymerase sigma-70 factor (ECF subfamily)
MDPVSHELASEQLRAHELWLRRLAGSLAERGAEADDLAQETWLAALRARPQERGALRPWLASVLRKIFARQRRSAGRAERRERAAAREDAQPSCVEALIALEQQEQLLHAVRSLEEPHRQLILWRYYEARSTRAIADELGIAEGAARMRLHRALAELRSRLAIAPRAHRARSWFVCGGLWMSAKSFGAAAAALALVGSAAWWILASAPESKEAPKQETITSAAPRSAPISDAASGATEGLVARTEGPALEEHGSASTTNTQSSADARLAVRVLDGEERPRVGFPLALGAARGVDLDERLAFAETVLSDAEGRVSFRSVAELAASLARGLGSEGEALATGSSSATRFFVAPAGLALVAPRLAFDPRALPREELSLIVPTCGTVSLHLRGGSAARRIRIEARALPRQTPVSSRRWSERSASTHAVDGDRLELRGVALDHLLHFTAIDLDGAAPESTLEAPGPSASDECCELVLDLAAPYPAIVGRVVTPHGVPVAHATLATRLRKESEGRLFRVGGVLVIDPPSPTQEQRTDEQGRFRVPIDQALALSGASALELALRTGTSSMERFVGWSVAWPLPPQLDSGEHDAGTLVLEETPLLAAGTVVGPRGEPLAEVSLAPLVPSAEEASGPTRWTTLDALATTSDARGHFELRGRIDASRIRLRAQRVGYAQSEEPEIDRGARELRLVLDAARELVGDVRLPEGLPGPDLEARLHLAGRFRGVTRLDREGRFRFTELASAPLRVSLWSAQGNRELWSLADALPHFEGESDPRLRDIPLDARWQAVPLRLLDEHDEPLAGAFLEAVPLDGAETESFHAEVGAAGRVALLVPASTTQLYIDIAQSSGSAIACRSAEQTVKLAPPIEVELLLEEPALAALRDERALLALALLSTPQLALPAEKLTRYVSLDTEGRARVRLPLAGTYRASWRRAETQGPVRAFRARSDDVSELVEIAGGGTRRVRLATPAWMR